MSQKLIAGQNCQINGETITVSIHAHNTADFSAFRLYDDGKTKHDEDFIFYGQKNISDHTVSLSMSENLAEFKISLDRLPENINKIAFSATSDFPNISSIGHMTLHLTQPNDDAFICEVDISERDESALILGELYRYNGKWKFRFINQGFRDGLKALAEFYGVDIIAEEKRGDFQSKNQTVNLNKVTLTKQSPEIDFEKHSISDGVFKINLNWNQGIPEKPKGLSGLFIGKPNSIDLDLGAYVRSKDGKQTIVQALGDRFGSLKKFPYLQLMGDDRTGSQADGEWIYVNGSKFNEIAEIVIYTFIYEGVPNWSSTDGRVRIDISGNPEIETCLSGSDNSLAMCAIARLSNVDGNLRIERLDRYFHGHRDMDHAFGWGFRWTSGSK